MDFQYVEPNNFLTIGVGGKVFLNNRGLNLLQGENMDDTSASSNGSGKSSIADALCWAWFGTTARGESGDDVVNSTAKKDCWVASAVKDGDVRYTVYRHRKHKVHKNSTVLLMTDASGAEINLSKGTEKETQAEIERVLGCTYDVFKASIYAGQEEMPDLPKMTDKQLKTLIEQAAGVERLERAYTTARSKANDQDRVVTAQKSTSARLATEIYNAEVAIEAAKLKHADHETQRVTRAQGLNARADAVHAGAVAKVAAIRGMGEEALTQEIAEINTQIASINEVAATAVVADKAAQQAERELAVLSSQVTQLTNAAKTLRVSYDNAEAELAKPCGACGKPHTPDELEQLRAHIKGQLEAKIAEVSAARTKEAEGKTKLEALRAEHARLFALVPDASALLKRAGEVNGALRQITNAKAVAAQDVAEVKRLRSEAQQVTDAPNPHKGAIDMLTAMVESKSKELQESQEALAVAVARLDVLAAVVQIFSPSGVRAHILDTITPFLNDRTAHYLSVLSDGNITATWSTLSRTAKGELRENFKIEVTHEKGGKSFGLISGGEKRKVRLSCMLALQDLCASRASKPINLWLGDEVDDALDEPGLERLMTILEAKAREKGTVIVISHNDISDWIDQTTLVRKQGGVSTISGALCLA